MIISVIDLESNYIRCKNLFNYSINSQKICVLINIKRRLRVWLIENRVCVLIVSLMVLLLQDALLKHNSMFKDVAIVKYHTKN